MREGTDLRDKLETWGHEADFQWIKPRDSRIRLRRLARLGLRENGRALGGSLKISRALDLELKAVDQKHKATWPTDWERVWTVEEKVTAYVQWLCLRRGIDAGVVDGKESPTTRDAATVLESVMTLPEMLLFSQQVLRGDFRSEEESVKDWCGPGGSYNLYELLDRVPQTSDALEAAARQEQLPKWPGVRAQLIGFVQQLCRQAGFPEVGAVDGLVGWRTVTAFDQLSWRFARGPKIGLALSGGGFRSAIFHLGVIRRLEELGIMPQVSVISSVSGGSIIAAYYLIEMERHLRSRNPNPVEALLEAEAHLRKARQDVRETQEEIREVEEEIGEREPAASEKSEKLAGDSPGDPGTDGDLHETREKLRKAREDLRKARVEIFEKIAAEFFSATDRNLRVRALVFSPFYHPLAVLKMLRPSYSRADLIQAEYDRWFYRKNTLDQLPYISTGRGSGPRGPSGPKLLINTTSLLTGGRVTFSRESISGIRELSRVNTNVLPLSRIVGASAGVPGLFPPTPISGDLLVDGGVSDNQGLEALWEEKCDVLLISDASGQIEQLHKLEAKAVAVLGRTNSIFQSGIRGQLIRRLMQWREKGPHLREFAFVHLHQSLKGDPEARWRVPSEYIAELARIRTDLDQFNPVERESLMFHGYTLIDSQLRRSCPRVWKSAVRSVGDKTGKLPDLNVPPLFRRQDASEGDAQGEPSAGEGAKKTIRELDKRKKIKKVLAAGQHPLLLRRVWARDGAKAGVAFALAWLLPLALFLIAPFGFAKLEEFAYGKLSPFSELGPLTSWLAGLLPEAVMAPLRLLGEHLSWPISFRGLLAAILLAASSYVLFFLTYSAIRWLSARWDRRTYSQLTRRDPSDPKQVRWTPAPSTAGRDQPAASGKEPLLKSLELPAQEPERADCSPDVAA